ncbi:hypothetical protein G7Z17_g8748 [Cylindrodendrum hubeiense]|uniref:Uncharacterized protein n=1 Tax=Cylindrodendrum hubeiense TaxID=595255 RepID=A0A9P5H5V8_9HYPO|nr:hypothetical protein G7Z17_g8748 [Cylindrodendrum hubeiense]
MEAAPSLDDTVQPASLQCAEGPETSQAPIIMAEGDSYDTDDGSIEFCVTEKEEARIFQDIRNLYNAGASLFSSARLRDLEQQLARQPKTASITGIDGIQYSHSATPPSDDEVTSWQVLGSHGITVLDGVKGFLEVDDSTVVVTVSPNVPVKQIIADLARPAIIIWNRVTPAEEDTTEWTKETFGPEGVETWLSPYGTDPDSARVRSMVQSQYALFPFPTDENFPDVEIYIRKE